MVVIAAGSPCWRPKNSIMFLNLSLKHISLGLFALSLPMQAFYHPEAPPPSDRLGWELIVWGILASSYLKPVFLSVSWFANLTYLACLFPVRTKKGHTLQKVFACLSIGLALLFLFPAETSYTYRHGDSYAGSVWLPVVLGTGYYTWLVAHVTIAIYIFRLRGLEIAPPSKDGS